MLNWTPLVEPMNFIQPYWYLLLIPISFGISIMYRAIRETSYSNYWKAVLVMTAQIVISIFAIAFLLILFVQWGIPLLN